MRQAPARLPPAGVGCGKDIFCDPGIGNARRAAAADRVQQKHAIAVEKLRAAAEILVVKADADEATLRELWKLAIDGSPVTQTVMRGTPVKTEFEAV